MWEELDKRFRGEGRASGAAGRATRRASSRPRGREDLALDALRRQWVPETFHTWLEDALAAFGGRYGGRFRHRGCGRGACWQHALSCPSARAWGVGDRVDLARARLLADRRERRGEAIDAAARLRRLGMLARRVRDRRQQTSSSRAALAALPAQFEGIFRKHMLVRGANAATRPTTASSTTSGPRSGTTSGEGWTPFEGRPDERGGAPVGRRRVTVVEAMELLPGPAGSGSRRCSGTGPWRSRSTPHGARTRRRRTPATSCTWSSAEPESSSTGPSATPSGRATCCSCRRASSTASKEFTDDLAVWVVFYGPEGGEAQ